MSRENCYRINYRYYDIDFERFFYRLFYRFGLNFVCRLFCFRGRDVIGGIGEGGVIRLAVLGFVGFWKLLERVCVFFCR